MTREEFCKKAERYRSNMEMALPALKTQVENLDTLICHIENKGFSAGLLDSVERSGNRAADVAKDIQNAAERILELDPKE